MPHVSPVTALFVWTTNVECSTNDNTNIQSETFACFVYRTSDPSDQPAKYTIPCDHLIVGDPNSPNAFCVRQQQYPIVFLIQHWNTG